MADIDEGYTGSAKDLHLYYIEKRRSEEDDIEYYKDMNDEQLIHQYHYFSFLVLFSLINLKLQMFFVIGHTPQILINVIMTSSFC